MGELIHPGWGWEVCTSSSCQKTMQQRAVIVCQLVLARGKTDLIRLYPVLMCSMHKRTLIILRARERGSSRCLWQLAHTRDASLSTLTVRAFVCMWALPLILSLSLSLSFSWSVRHLVFEDTKHPGAFITEISLLLPPAKQEGIVAKAVSEVLSSSTSLDGQRDRWGSFFSLTRSMSDHLQLRGWFFFFF